MSQHKASNTRRYLLAQCLFWGAYACFNVVIVALFGKLQTIGLVKVMLLATILTFVSHAMRLMYKRWAREWSLTRVVIAGVILIPLFAVLTLLVLSLLTRLVLIVFPLLIVDAQVTSGNWQLIYALNLSVILGFWTALYLSVDQFRRRRETEIAHWRTLARLHEAELQFLRSQINSHFLFNALNNLRALIRENPDLARERLTQLASLLRAILQAEQRDKITLAAELDVVQSYVDLETLQFEERLQVQWQIDEQAKAMSIPAMLLQTLVENAIKHGIACRRSGGVVSIQAEKHGSNLHVTISNPPPDSEGRAESTGLGLQNARARLQRIFGDKARLDLIRAEAQVVAVVEIPQ